MNIKIKTRKDIGKIITFVLSMAIACTRDYGDIHTGFYLQSGIGMIWIIFAIIKFLKNRQKNQSLLLKDIIWFLKLYLLPQIVMYIYAILLMMFGLSEWKYLGTNITSFVPIILAIMSYYLFKEEALKFIIISVGLSWVISIVFALKTHGLYIIRQAIIQGYLDHYYHYSEFARDNYFEIHDIVLSVGYFIVYYLYTKKKVAKRERKWDKKYIVLFLMISLMGIKRIALLGILVAWLFKFLFDKLGKNRKNICLVAGWIGFIVCFAFIGVLISGEWFYNTIKTFGINPAGRDRYFRAVLNYASFNPLYFGLGRGAVNRILTNELSYIGIAGVHSDIIKLYVENGFLLFGWWLWYYLIHIPKKYERRFNVESMMLYFGIIIYMFVLYLTDNTDTYFACQILSILLPMTYAIKQRSNEIARKN